MDHLTDKGIRSKRFALLIAFTILVTVAFFKGMITAPDWLGFLKWAYGLFALSEVGKAGAQAFRDKGVSDA